jgi:hypothetical protein
VCTLETEHFEDCSAVVEEEEGLHGVHRRLRRNEHPKTKRAARSSAEKQTVTQKRPTPRKPLCAVVRRKNPQGCQPLVGYPAFHVNSWSQPTTSAGGNESIPPVFNGTLLPAVRQPTAGSSVGVRGKPPKSPYHPTMPQPRIDPGTESSGEGDTGGPAKFFAAAVPTQNRTWDLTQALVESQPL